MATNQLSPQQRRSFLADLMNGNLNAENSAIAQQYGAFDNEAARLGNYPAPEGPMNDMSFPMPSDYGMENEARRLSNYPAPSPFSAGNAHLGLRPDGTPMTMADVGPSLDSKSLTLADLPIARGQGAIQRKGGNLITTQPGGWTDTVTGQVLAPNTSSSAGGSSQNISYANPVDMMGKKGYLQPDGTVIGQDGVKIGEAAGTAARRNAEILNQRANEEFMLKRAKAIAELAHTDAQTRKLMGGPDTGMPANLRLKQDEMWNPQTGQVEAVPGSDLFQKQMGKVAEAKQGLREGTKMFDRVGGVVDELTKGNINPAVGWFDALAPSWVSMTPQDKANARSKIKNLQSLLENQGIRDLRAAGVAPGSITEKEWEKFRAAVGNIDPTLSEEEFGKQLDKVKQQIDTSKANLAQHAEDVKGQYGSLWNRTGNAPQPSGAEQQAALMREAEAAIARGAPRDLVMKRLQEKMQGVSAPRPPQW